MGETAPYRPSNGTEGDIFMSAFCFRCKHDEDELAPCEILGRTLWNEVGDANYPTEWVCDAGDAWGRTACCTAFAARCDGAGAELPSTISDDRQIGMAL